MDGRYQQQPIIKEQNAETKLCIQTTVSNKLHFIYKVEGLGTAFTKIVEDDKEADKAIPFVADFFLFDLYCTYMYIDTLNNTINAPIICKGSVRLSSNNKALQIAAETNRKASIVLTIGAPRYLIDNEQLPTKQANYLIDDI